ncbi:MAG: gamma carbonic anhydrase family protein, partial [Flammeovirgaceae bacterium]
MNAKVYIGYNVTVGSNCTLYSCHIGDDVFIGDRCVILEG